MMGTILDTIVDYKRLEVAGRKKEIPVKRLESATFFTRSCYSLCASLKNKNRSGIIAEFKRCSPSKGIINTDAQVSEVTRGYTEHGASGLSILTDEHFFNGNKEDLYKGRANVIPILRKEFIIDEYQVIETKAIGADVILLIAECLGKKKIKQFAALSKSLGLEVLLEMHSESQIEKITTDVTLVGINNRDLKTFQVDIDRSIALSGKLPEGMMKIAESGIDNPETILKMKKSGFDGFLMGEYFMKQKNPGKAFNDFVKELKLNESGSHISQQTIVKSYNR